jgi:hypothetical protein
LIWAIIAFLYEGDSYRNNRNTYDAYTRERSNIQSTDKKADEKGLQEKKRTGTHTVE